MMRTSRHLASLTVTVALIGTLLLNGCIACSALFAKTPSSSHCCTPKGECERPKPAAPDHKDCSSSVADLSTVERQVPVVKITAIAPPVALDYAPISRAQLCSQLVAKEYSPPDPFLATVLRI
jgi:hypothetical protein